MFRVEHAQRARNVGPFHVPEFRGDVDNPVAGIASASTSARSASGTGGTGRVDEIAAPLPGGHDREGRGANQ